MHSPACTWLGLTEKEWITGASGAAVGTGVAVAESTTLMFCCASSSRPARSPQGHRPRCRLPQGSPGSSRRPERLPTASHRWPSGSPCSRSLHFPAHHHALAQGDLARGVDGKAGDERRVGCQLDWDADLLHHDRVVGEDDAQVVGECSRAGIPGSCPLRLRHGPASVLLPCKSRPL